MRIHLILIGVIACTTLAGCFGGNSSNDTPATGMSTPEPEAASSDSFSKAVASVVANDDDSAEASSIEQIVQTAPDDAEPMPLKL